MRMFNKDKADARRRVSRERAARKEEGKKARPERDLKPNPDKVLGAPLDPPDHRDFTHQVPGDATTTAGTSQVERPARRSKNVKPTAPEGGRETHEPTYYRRGKR